MKRNILLTIVLSLLLTAFVPVTAFAKPAEPSNHSGGCNAMDDCGDTPSEPTTPYPVQDPEPEAETQAAAITSLPSLSNFTVTESTYEANKVTLTFTPDGNPGFELHVQVAFSNGVSTLSTWCTGDASLCKAVGDGKVCSATGAKDWCYQEESSASSASSGSSIDNGDNDNCPNPGQCL